MFQLEVRQYPQEISTIRAYRIGIDDDAQGNDRYSYYLWLQHGGIEYDKLPLDIGNHIDLRLEDPVCKRCNSTGKLLIGLCDNCQGVESKFLTRMKCCWDHGDSLLNTEGCTRKDMGCENKSNAKLCYSSYILYLGRIGNRIKVGISRKKRRGGYMMRLVEQGLNEATVMHNFSSLPEVLKQERWFKNLHYNDSLTFEDKIDELRGEPRISLLQEWPLSFWQESFQDHQFEHFNLYENKYFPDISRGDDNRIQGEIIHIQGPMIICNTDEGLRYWDIRRFVDREVLQ